MKITHSLFKKFAHIKAVGGALIILLMLISMPSRFVAAAPLLANAIDGDGTLTVSPTSVVYDSTTTFDFTFTADSGNFVSGAQLVLSIPTGWTPPSNSGAGHVTILSNTCTLRSPGAEIAGFVNTPPMTVSVDFGCAQGESFTVRYASAKPPAAMLYTFTTTTEVVGGTAPATIAVSPTVDVTPKTITIGATALSADNKVYNGTTDATITIGDKSLVGVVTGDTVSLDTSAWTASFADKHAANGKTVTIGGLTLTGASAGNYSLTQPTRTANITKLPITITAVSETKAYDGTASSSGLPVLSVGTPLASGDSEPTWTQTFNNENAGTGKTLTPAGLVVDDNSGLNYQYTYTPNTSGIITKKPITVTAVTSSKVYDGVTSSSGLPVLSVSTPLASGDSEPTWTQTFDTKDVGANKILTPAGLVVDGNSGLNYEYTYITVATGEVTQKAITVTADAKSKAFGAADPVLTYQAAPALAVGDAFSGALTRDPGTAPGVYAITQGGLSAGGNYAMSFVGANLTINPKISGNAGASGVTLRYNDGGPKSVISNSSGDYSLVVSYGWSGTVTPSRSGYVFSPSNIAYTNVITNQSGMNYVAMLERVKNGGFNTYIGASKIPQYWTAAGFGATDGKDLVVKKEGAASVKIIGAAGATHTLTQTITLSGASGNPFTFSVWIKGSSIPAAGICRAQVLLYNGATLNLTKTINCSSGTYGFQKKILSFTSSAPYTKVVIKFTYSKISGTVWFDAVSLMR
jgi:hypothetical protein